MSHKINQIFKLILILVCTLLSTEKCCRDEGIRELREEQVRLLPVP